MPPGRLCCISGLASYGAYGSDDLGMLVGFHLFERRIYATDVWLHPGNLCIYWQPEMVSSRGNPVG